MCRARELLGRACDPPLGLGPISPMGQTAGDIVLCPSKRLLHTAAGGSLWKLIQTALLLCSQFSTGSHHPSASPPSSSRADRWPPCCSPGVSAVFPSPIACVPSACRTPPVCGVRLAPGGPRKGAVCPRIRSTPARSALFILTSVLLNIITPLHGHLFVRLDCSVNSGRKPCSLLCSRT